MPFLPPVPPSSRALPPLCVLPVCPPVLQLPRALRVPPSLLRATPVPLPCVPLSRLSPLPFSFSLSTLPVRLPSLSEPRCHSCVPPACSTPAPPPRPYPFPWGLPHPSAPSVPVSHPILVAVCPVGGGGGYLRTGLWPCPRTGMAVGFLRTMSHRMCRRNTERTSGRRLSNSLRCICTVEPSRIDQLRTSAPVPTRRGHQGFTLRCTSQVSHGDGGHQGWAWSTPQSSAHVSPMFSMQHHPVMQRALPPYTKSADSPQTPAASPQGRHRDVAPLHRTRVHPHCHLPIPAISPITPSANTLAPTCRNIGCVCPFVSPASQSPGTVLHPKGRALLHAIAGRSCQSRPCALLCHCTTFRYCIPSASRSAPHCSPYPRYVSRPAAWLLPPHLPAPPYSAAPSPLSPAAGPVLSAWGSRPGPPSPHPPPLSAVSLPSPAHLHLSAPFLLSSCLSHPLLTLLHLRRPPASASPHPICPSLRTPLAPGP